MPDKEETTNPNLEHNNSTKQSLTRRPVEQLCATKDIDRDLVEEELRRRFEESRLD